MKKQSEILQIPIHQIIPDPNQPRQSFNEEENIELALSVKKDGILQPVLVRPTVSSTKEIKYMLVFGHRRLWAAKYNKMSNIPAQVKDLTDDEALHIQVIENLQRKNINPMEEADAFSRLITKSITSAEQIADELGVSKKYVYDRLSLKKVIEPVQDLIRNGKLTISHGKQFARLKSEDQEKLMENLYSSEDQEEVSVSDLRRVITDTFTYKLTDAIFSTADTKLIAKAGSCEKCQKRSGCNILLFDDIQQEDICFDKTCYQKKTDAQIEKLIKDLEAEGKKVLRISASYGGAPEGVLSTEFWDESNEEQANTWGIVIHAYPYSSYRIGQIIPIELLTDEEEEEETDENNEEGPMARGINQLIGQKKYVDHDNEILNQVIDAAFEAFSLTPHFSDQFYSHKILLNKIERNIRCMWDTSAAKIAKLFDIKLSEELNNEPDSTGISKLAVSHFKNIGFKDLKSVCALTELIIESQIEYEYDKNEIIELTDLLYPIGIDLMVILTKYSEKTGYQIPE